MNLRRTARQLPLRLAAGSFVLNSGLSKWSADEVTVNQSQNIWLVAIGASLVIDDLVGKKK